MASKGFAMRGVWLLLVALLALHATVVAAGEEKKKRKRRAPSDEGTIFFGATPSGSTEWKSDSAGSISTFIDTSHLKFDRVPRYICTVTMETRKAGFPVNATVDMMHDSYALVNVTGKTTVVNPTAAGFKVRLRYDPSLDKNLTAGVARLGSWRVRWVALTDSNSLVEAAREDVINEKYELGIDEKPVGQSLAYVKALEALVKEDEKMVKALIGTDFEKVLSKRPTPKVKPATADQEDAKEENAADASPSEENESSNNADADASADGDSAE
mmetsp:Transcript_15531/g.27588  ORF Transcript_15531/g.27588 Transcript_15531/m.27588 type:complete len:271 (-) Transcript_15531:91-903(-)